MPMALLMYDIMYQYRVNFRRRIRKSPELALPSSLILQTGISLFHIHGHQDSCLPQYLPSFIPGAKQVDGEIIETLWAPAILISWALHLIVTWLLLATFGANWWGPVRAIKQGDPVKEGHFAHLLDLLANFDLGRSTVWATCLLMLPITAQRTGLLLLSWAFLRLVSSLPATEAFELARMAIHENRHFYRSMGVGDEWR